MVYYVASSEVALGIFGMKIVLKFGCCVDEAQLGVWKLLAKPEETSSNVYKSTKPVTPRKYVTISN